MGASGGWIDPFVSVAWAGIQMYKQLQHMQEKGQESFGPLGQTGSSSLSI